jgi:predicted phosphodiesterase
MTLTPTVILFWCTLSVFLLLVNFFLITNAYAEFKDNDFNFVAAGDWGCGRDAIKTLSIMKSMHPEIYLGLGDYSYTDSTDCWVKIVKSVDNNFKIAFGNHDTSNKLLDAFMDKFNLKRQYYSFNYQNAHFIALSTELNKLGDQEQLEFVKNDLLEAKANENINWIIVYFHKPFYSDEKSLIESMVRNYHPLFQKMGVDIVLQGHLHNYQRTYPLLYNSNSHSKPIISNREQFEYDDPSGIIFVTVGTGGESIQTLQKQSYLASTYEGFGCINVRIKGNNMIVEYYSDSHDTIDKFQITKNIKTSDTKTEVQQIEYHKAR